MDDALDRWVRARILVPALVAGAGVAWASAWVLRRQAQLVAALEAAQEALAISAANEERSRIAAELHDVIAHSLTVVLLHASSARLAIQDRPEDALDALARVEEVGRQSLADLRRAVALLASPTAEPPPPDTAALEVLMAEYRAAGLDVTARIDGPVADLPADTKLALYRMAEEALANAARHAPGAAVDVELRVTSESAVLRIDNGPPHGRRPEEPAERADGLGLAGMRRRADEVGARLEAGPHDGGWRVLVDVSLDGGAADRE